ncbi:MAG: hypothetical protein OHK0050_31500 [Roseiflexaceae bacterium]
MLSLVQQIIRVGLYEVDLVHHTVFWSDELYDILGFDRQTPPMRPDAMMHMVHPHDYDRVIAQRDRFLATWQSPALEYRIIRPDGAIRSLLSEPRIEYNINGQPIRIRGAILDLTNLRQAEARLYQTSMVFEHALEGIMITDADRRILAINRAFTSITGYSEAEVIGQLAGFMRSGSHDDAFYRVMWQSITTTGHWQGEIWNRRKNGEIYPEWLSITCIHDHHGSISNYIGMFSDLSQIKRSEAKLSHLVHYDTLTNLPNRLFLFTRIDHALAHARRHDRKVALLLLDIDRFKNINDSLGHAVGDELLLHFAQRLAGRIRQDDTIARLGGDEFVVLLEDIREAEEAGSVAQDLIDRLRSPFILSDTSDMVVDVSVGISLAPTDANSSEQLLRNAETAMYQAKQQGGSTYQFYSAQMTRQVNQRLALESNLRRAIERQELRLVYQPQYSVHHGSLTGLETLVRWHHPVQGFISPGEFIPIAEETGLIIPLGEWVFRQMCVQIRQWLDAGLSVPRVAFNLSPRQLFHQNLLQRVTHVLHETGVPGDMIECEITETSMMIDPEQAALTFNALRDLGLKFAVDDFGTGYSSLAYLKRFPIDRLKIDRSFIHGLPDHETNRAIVTAILAMAHSLEIAVLAEGVETIAELAFLGHIGTATYQGFLASQPVPAEQIEQMLRSSGQRSLHSGRE